LRTIRYLQAGGATGTNHEQGARANQVWRGRILIPGLVADGVDAHGGRLVAVARHLDRRRAEGAGAGRRCRWAWALAEEGGAAEPETHHRFDVSANFVTIFFLK